MVSHILAQVFRDTEVTPLTSRDGNDLIAQYHNMVLLITISPNDVQKLDVFHLCGYQLGNPLQDAALSARLNGWYQHGMESYLRDVVQAGNAEYLPEPAKLYLLRHGAVSVFSRAPGDS